MEKIGMKLAYALDKNGILAQQEIQSIQRALQIQDRQMDLISEYGEIEKEKLPQGQFQVDQVIEDEGKFRAYQKAYQEQVVPDLDEPVAEVNWYRIPYDLVRHIAFNLIRNILPLVEMEVEANNGQAEKVHATA